MFGECWMCDAPLDEEEVQYCSACELGLLTEIAQETEVE
jgi:hypothetical protein